MKKKILLYYPPNRRSVAIETLCRAVREDGHEIIILTLTERGPFHDEMERLGIPVFTTVMKRRPSWKYFYQQARYLISFCKKHAIDTVWSHLQEANLIAVLAQPFLKSRVVAFRHHAESAFYAEYGEQFGMQRSKNESRVDKIINRLAKRIVVPSSGVWYGMEKYEGCNMGKVSLLPYIYDFSSYQKPDEAAVAKLKETYPCKLLLIMVSRMISSKQHMPVFEVLKILIQEGLSVKMIVMDDGPLRATLEKFTKDHQLEDHIFFVGFKSDFINYMAASDILMHPSLTEASSNVVKEMGLLSKTVAVCDQVGDFDDYIIDRVNGFVLQRKSLKASIESTIREACANPEKLTAMGKQLNHAVVQLFSDTALNRRRFTELADIS